MARSSYFGRTGGWRGDRQWRSPLAWKVDPARVPNKWSVEEGLGKDGWTSDIAESLTSEGIGQCVQLWLAITRVQRNNTAEDVFSWPCSTTGTYSAKVTYKKRKAHWKIGEVQRQVI
jgi:hypothetical protein